MFPVGRGGGEFQTSEPIRGCADCPEGPGAMFFDDKGRLYISDDLSGRVQVFTEKGKFVSELKLKGRADRSVTGMIQDSSFIGYGNDGNAILEIWDSSGEKHVYVYFNELPVDRYIKSYFYYGNVLFFHDGEGRLFSIVNPSLDEAANRKNFRNTEQTRKLFQPGSGFNLKGLTLDSEDRIFLNGELQTRDFAAFFSFWAKLYKNEKSKLTKTGSYYGLSSASYMDFIGNDRNSNWYWYIGRKYVIIHNKDGAVISELEIDPEKSRIIPAVHPSGDVYFLSYDDKGVYLYKIARRW
jgi:hypothetical protein